MLKTKRSFFITTIIVLTAALVFYLYSSGKLPGYRDEDTLNLVSDAGVIYSREIDVVYTFDVPGGEDVVRYSVFLDEKGNIVDMEAHGVFDSSLDIKLGEFSEGLLLVIKGKKLADLEEVDKVGKSTLTTDAFNGALGEFKAQI